MKTKILATGLSGMIGSRIEELLQESYAFENLSLETGVDITDKETVMRRVSGSGAEIVLHLAAKTDVDGCEKDKVLGKSGEAWKSNVLGTQNIVEACQKFAKKIIYISTDFVFDGENPPPGGYTEESAPNPINWYGVTKYEGEKIAYHSDLPYLICRLGFPYRTEFPPKKDFVRAILARLENNEEVKAVSDQIFTPTFIDDIAWALDILIKKQAVGIYHLVGSESLTPYEAARLIAQIFGFPENLVQKIGANGYFANRAPRPFKLILTNDKIRKLGVEMRTFEEGLAEIKKQMDNFKF